MGAVVADQAKVADTIFIIGHSHGGTVLLRTLSQITDRDLSSKLRGVTLGTPFFHARLRSLFLVGSRVVDVLGIEMERKNRGLWHSKYYDDDAAVKGTVAWIRRCLCR